MRMILGKLLRELGFEITEAGDGKQALDQLNPSQLPDLALVDWNMPVMNGLEFVQAVRANHQYDQVPLMMVTTETDMERVVAAIDAGANEYVMKPFTKEIMLEKLRLLGMTEY
jgi:two-component system chemotaxis response regulator CheY